VACFIEIHPLNRVTRNAVKGQTDRRTDGQTDSWRTARTGGRTAFQTRYCLRLGFFDGGKI